MGFCSVFLGLIPLGLSGFIKPPIEGDQLPVETNIGTSTIPIITSETITHSVMLSIVFFSKEVTLFKM